MPSIVIPAYNEENTITQLLQKIIDLKLPYDFSKEIIVVDDCSTDNTNQLAKSTLEKSGMKYKIITNTTNLGKSQSVKEGMLETEGEWVVVQDADLEYNPDDIAFMLEQGIKQKMDVVYGNRFGKDNGMIYIKNFYGNLFISLISNLFTIHKTRVNIPDMEVCYKLAKGDVVRHIAPTISATSNFGIEPELTAKLAYYKKENGNGLSFLCLPISYYPRTIEQGKKMKAFKDGFKAFAEILKYNIFKDPAINQ